MLNLNYLAASLIRKVESTIHWVSFRVGFAGGLNRTIQSFYFCSGVSFRIATLILKLYTNNRKAFTNLVTRIEILRKKFLKSAK